MANVNSPFGLAPIGLAAGGEVRTNVFAQYTIASALNATIDQFSPVVLTGTDTNITAGAGTGEYLIGSFLGVEYIDAYGTPQFKRNWVAATPIKSGTVAKAIVADDPNTLFEIQGNSESWAAADIGLNVDYSVGTRNATINRAGTVAVRTGIAGTATLMLRLLELSREITTNDFGAYARLIVKINAHRYATATGA